MTGSMAMVILSWGTVGKALSNGKKAYGFFQDCKRANDVDIPENGHMLWMMLDAMQEPLRLCVDFAKRFDTMPLVEHAVTLAQSVMSDCESTLQQRDDGDDDDDEDDVKRCTKWTEWWRATDKKGDLERLLARLSRAQQTLQLALAAVAAARGMSRIQRFYYIPAASASAELLLQQFEFNRVDEGGWLLAQSTMHEFLVPSGNPQSRGRWMETFERCQVSFVYNMIVLAGKRGLLLYCL